MHRPWRRGPDRELEARLRANRPTPDPALVRTIAESVRPVHGRTRGRRRVPLVLAGGLTAIALTPVIALGGAGAVLGTMTAQLNPGSAQAEVAAPALLQYGVRVTTCVLGKVRVRLPRSTIRELATLEVLRLGPCRPRPARRPAALKVRPLRSVCVLTKLQTNLPVRIADRLTELELVTPRRCAVQRT